MEEIHLCKADIDDIKKKIPVYLLCNKKTLNDGNYLLSSTNVVVKLESAGLEEKECVLFKLMLTGINAEVLKISYFGRLVKPKKVKKCK